MMLHMPHAAVGQEFSDRDTDIWLINNFIAY